MNLIKFDAPVNARAAEAEIVNAIKEAIYKFSDVVTVAQAIGCLEIVKAEIYEEAK